MAEVIRMPRLSDTMEEGKVAKWHKNVGDKVEEGDVLAEIETDKAVQDFESEFDGVLLYQGVQEGESTVVEGILAIIGEEGEDISGLKDGNSESEKPEEKPSENAKADSSEESDSSAEIPDNVEVIRMPRLSDTMEEGKVAKWHKNVGDKVEEGDVLAEIETDKAVQDFESEFDGVLLYQGVQEGESTVVEGILAIVGPEGTDVSGITSGKPLENKKENKKDSNVSEKENKEKPMAVVAKGTSGTSISDRIAISPLAKKMAEDRGIDISTIEGSGDGGRIIKRDVENYKASAATKSAPSEAPKAAIAAPVINVVKGEDTETPNSQVRNIIAKRLSESKFTAPHYYLIMEINMDKAVAARKDINSIPDTKISFNDMVIKATAMALRKHPMVNSTWAGDKIIHHGDINVGVAVAIPDGLVVPVLKNTDFMSYSQISASVKDLASRARNKGLKANEMEGSTFTVSNLGMYGIQTFTSIINQPNSAILSVGAIIEKPIVRDGQIVPGNVMQVSLACDHRVVDGATGSEFLQTLKTYLENPLSMFV